MNKIPVLMCIDVEPDERAGDHSVPKDWTGFPETAAFFAELRPRLEAATGSPVHFTWFVRMDPGVVELHGSADWAISRYRSIFDEIIAAGDEIGLHVHPWRKDRDTNGWVADFADQAWVETCVRTSFSAFQASLKRPCTCFRFGDRWLNSPTLDLVEQLGARFDLTMEPGYQPWTLAESFLGTGPDYSNIPQQPYRPSRTDLTQHDAGNSRRLWEIPLSAGRVDGRSVTAIRRHAGSSWIIERPDATTTGVIAASPNPAQAVGPDGHGEIQLTWVSSGTAATEVRIGAPDGALFCRGGASGESPTGQWVKDGMTFFLQDVSGDLSLTSANTLSTVRVGVIPGSTGMPQPEASHVTANLAFSSAVVCRIVDAVVSASPTPYLAPVLRSDVAVSPAYRLNLEETFEHILFHPLVRQFVFETPAQAIERLI